MALVKYGGGILEIRGSIGGQVHSKNRYGHFIRQRTIPVNPNSSRQQAIRNVMGSVVSAWFSVLSAAQRSAWGVYAAAISFTNKLGETITLTGFNHYVRTNISRVSNGLSRINDGPVDLTLPATDPIFNVAFSEATQLVTVNFDDTQPWASQNSAFMSIHQGIPKNSATQFFGGHFRRIGKLDGSLSSPITSPQTVALSFPVATVQKDWAMGRIQEDDGRLSEKFRDDAVVGA